ncbi:MAG: hypothetical protein A2X86_10995 [Bdellovibrionales bacterium GWA2_49_15]|nr:MAG: hypothetical protein A2X86_10995 [Bdellovibrionales bacterium GWA2_49_15]HAZ11503.1 hypothetical protein [Bdellovibrionales bacterium]
MTPVKGPNSKAVTQKLNSLPEFKQESRPLTTVSGGREVARIVGFNNKFILVIVGLSLVLNFYLFHSRSTGHSTAVSDESSFPIYSSEVKLIDPLPVKMPYKKIILNDYVQIDPNAYEDLPSLQLAITNGRHRFEQDMKFNEDIFVNAHDIGGKDLPKYHQFQEQKLTLSKQLNEHYDQIFKRWQIASRNYHVSKVITGQ